MDENALTDRPAQSRAVTCRRRNRVHDAIVEAALTIERTLGLGYALALLRRENVPDAVAARILGQGPRQLRAGRRTRPASPG